MLQVVVQSEGSKGKLRFISAMIQLVTT